MRPAFQKKLLMLIGAPFIALIILYLIMPSSSSQQETNHAPIAPASHVSLPIIVSKPSVEKSDFAKKDDTIITELETVKGTEFIIKKQLTKSGLKIKHAKIQDFGDNSYIISGTILNKGPTALRELNLHYKTEKDIGVEQLLGNKNPPFKSNHSLGFAIQLPYQPQKVELYVK